MKGFPVQGVLVREFSVPEAGSSLPAYIDSWYSPFLPLNDPSFIGYLKGVFSLSLGTTFSISGRVPVGGDMSGFAFAGFTFATIS